MTQLLSLICISLLLSSSAVVASLNTLPRLEFEIVKRWPSDPELFTQGLVLNKGQLYQSGGGYNRSSLVTRTPQQANARISRKLPRRWFAEGITVCNDELFLLTWRRQIAAVYEPETLTETRRLRYRGQGWGLTCHQDELLMSNGTATLYWRNSNDFRVLRSVEVKANGKPLTNLNELEWINGYIYANIWQTSSIAQIDPKTGNVRAIIVLDNLLSPKQSKNAGVLNGIAWDPERQLLLVTGKHWPILFGLKLPAIADSGTSTP